MHAQLRRAAIPSPPCPALAPACASEPRRRDDRDTAACGCGCCCLACCPRSTQLKDVQSYWRRTVAPSQRRRRAPTPRPDAAARATAAQMQDDFQRGQTGPLQASGQVWLASAGAPPAAAPRPEVSSARRWLESWNIRRRCQYGQAGSEWREGAATARGEDAAAAHRCTTLCTARATAAAPAH